MQEPSPDGSFALPERFEAKTDFITVGDKMKNGLIKVLRMYSSADAETVAATAGIPLARYKRIENEEEMPTESELERIAAVFGISTDFFSDDFPDRFVLRQTLDETVFVTEELREQMKLRMTELSPLEKQLVMFIRRTDNRDETLRRFIDILISEIQD